MVATAIMMTQAACTIVQTHCGTLDGPLIADARKAPESGDVTPVLQWVKQKDEKNIRKAFDRALKARGKKNAEAAGNRFFATLVKIHRAGEGAPFTGLKPAGAVEPSVAEAIIKKDGKMIIQYPICSIV